MAFKFRLQSVLDHRTHLEELALNDFAVHIRAERECEEHIAWLENEHRRARAKITDMDVKGLSAPEFQLANEYATVLRLQALREQARLPRLKAETHQSRKKLMEARKNRLVLDTLKERHRRRYDYEQLMAEQRIIDEAAVAGFLRRQTS
jgi:flagellar FliJ protein